MAKILTINKKGVPDMAGIFVALLVSQNIFAKVVEWTADVNALSVVQTGVEDMP